VSFETPEYTANTDALGTLRLLEAIRILSHAGRGAFLQASTSECSESAGDAGNASSRLLSAQPHAWPSSTPYWITVNYREAYGMHASNGICSTTNRRSAARPSSLASHDRAVAAIERGYQECLYLGNLDAQRDGAMPATMSSDVADPAAGPARRLRLATGERLRAGIRRAGLSSDRRPHRVARWWRRRTGLLPGGPARCWGRSTGSYRRPTEVDLLLGDPAKALRKLGCGTARLCEAGGRDGGSRSPRDEEHGSQYGHGPKLHAAQ